MKKQPPLFSRFIPVLGLLCLAIATVLAQSAPSTAPGWLDAARVTHGGTTLETLTGYRETGIFRIPPAGSQAQVDGTYTISADLSGNRYRRDYTIGSVRFIQQYSNGAGFAWNSSSNRKEPAPATGLAVLKAGLYQGWLGLRFKTRDSSALLGSQTYGTVTGTAVNATTSGVTTQFLFSSTGELIAEKLELTGFGALVAEYRNLQVRNGLKIPLEIRLLRGTTLVATEIAQTTVLNPTWTTTDFAEP